MMFSEDFMITNGDNIYKEGIYRSVYSNNPEIIQVTIDYKKEYDDDDMKVTLDSNRHALKILKVIPQDRIHAESVGLALIKGKKYRRSFANKILELIRIKKNLDYLLVILNSLIDDGVPVFTAEISRDS